MARTVTTAERLRPTGGPAAKTLAAWLILKAGRSLRQNAIGPEHANRRIPAPAGEPAESYNDSFVFEGSDGEGNLFMSRIGFRDGGSSAEVWLWTVLDGVKRWISGALVEAHPAEQQRIEAGGLAFTCTDDAVDRWRIAYSGHLAPDGVRCEVDLTFERRSALYHSGVHMNAMAFARAMAEMPWSRKYFERLRTENQCRIEQGGRLVGRISVDGRSRPIDMLSIRDHSWGKRDWTYLNRYIWTIVSLEDDLWIAGEPHRYLVCSTVDYGATFRHLVTGWVAGPRSVRPIVAASEMGPIGGDGTIPERFVVRFRPEGGRVLTMEVRRSPVEHSWLTQGGRFEVCEAPCAVTVDGVPGHGMSELGYSAEAGYGHRFPTAQGGDAIAHQSGNTSGRPETR